MVSSVPCSARNFSCWEASSLLIWGIIFVVWLISWWRWLDNMIIPDISLLRYAFPLWKLNTCSWRTRATFLISTFLCQDTFYNDMRHRSATDYSKPILDWLQNSSDEAAEKWDAITSGVLKKRQKDLLRGLNISNMPEFKSERMQTTRFSDLHFRPGAGYLYCHQVLSSILLP